MNRRKYLATISATVTGAALAGCSSESDDRTGGGDDNTPTSTSDPASQLEISGQISGDDVSEAKIGLGIGIKNPTDQSVTAEFTASLMVADNRGELTSEPIEETIPSNEELNISPILLEHISDDWEKAMGVFYYGGTLQISVNGNPQTMSCFDSIEGGDWESTSEGCEYYGVFSTHVEVEYSGDWDGVVGSDGDRRDISRSSIDAGAPPGEEKSYIPISEDATTVSATAQKREDSSEQLTIRIVQGREVIAEQSTSSGYGQAEVSERL